MLNRIHYIKDAQNMSIEIRTSGQKYRKLMVLKKASADATKIPLSLEAFGNELYQAVWLLTCQESKETESRRSVSQE